MTLNFTRQRQLAHALLPGMIERRWGRIINITGKSEPETLNAAFAAKAAMHAWAKGLSREVGQHGITVNSANPEGTSQDEINAVQQLGTQDRAPDVLDLGQSFANKNVSLFAPYRVATWDSVPAANKDPNGAWVNDYGGFVSIGCNASLVATCPTTLADLAKPEYRGQVTLNGDPTQSASAFAGVWAGALANGGQKKTAQTLPLNVVPSVPVPGYSLNAPERL